MKQNANMDNSNVNFRKIGTKIDCKHKNGKWYSAEIKLYLNCKQTAVLIHYIDPINDKYCDDEWIFLETEINTICVCHGKCHKSHHRLSKANTQTRYKSHHIEASLSKQIEASIENKKMRSCSSPSNSITKTVTLKCGQDQNSIMLEYEDKSAKISLDCVNDGDISEKSVSTKSRSLGVFYNEIRKTLIGFGLEQFQYKLPHTYRWMDNKTRQIMGPQTTLEQLGNDVKYELRLKRSN